MYRTINNAELAIKPIDKLKWNCIKILSKRKIVNSKEDGVYCSAVLLEGQQRNRV